LLWHVHYEGHPWLWYALLWVVSKFTTLPFGMKVVEAFIGTAIYLLLGVGSPFGRFEKILLFLCYFISFEYTVITRMYGVLLLLLLFYLRQRVLHPKRFVRNALLLGLLASTDMIGLMLSFTILLEYISAAIAASGPAPAPAKRNLFYGVLGYFVLAAISVWSLKPAPDISWPTPGHLFEYAANWRHLLLTVARYVVLPYIPVRLSLSGHFWNPRIGNHPFAILSLAPLVLAAYYFTFRRHRSLLLLIGSTVVFSVTFGHLIYEGSMRHFGVTFLAFLGGIWILRSQLQRLPLPAYALLGLTSVAGCIAAFQAWQRPFSNAESAASWIKAHRFETTAIVGTPDTSVAGIAVLLHRPIYMLDCGCVDSFVFFSNRRDAFLISQIPDRLLIANNSLHTPGFAYIGTVPLSAAQEAEIENKGLVIKPLASFTGAEADDEDFYIYKMQH
jgi:hypothetical protein